ncbi:galactokinase family protein [Candidatus Frankia nodulisporulans]|uniref:galactokinase n=1 Tax=Candidatus Frankia nodulisporulans TaxID=2060052 RepID=UPI0013D3F02F|nr:galactokinase family protein [Candidatus Frankia nodulisporulans]
MSGCTAAERAVRLFVATYGRSPTHLVRSPGRVNLIGEHTDYNDGLCLPLALDRDLCVALRPSGPDTVAPGDDPHWGGRLHLVSEQDAAPAVVQLPPPGPDTPPSARASGWARYVEGVAVQLAAAGVDLTAWHGALTSDIPVGAGLSSSAALELAVVVAGLSLARTGQQGTTSPDAPSRMPLTVPPMDGSGLARVVDVVELARWGQRAENEWVGAATGLLDQLACAGGVAGHALRIDFRSLSVTPIPLPAGLAVVFLDTGTRRELVTSAYAQRRAECARASQALGVPSLRDVTALPSDAEHRLDEVALRRARYVLAENARVDAVVAALTGNDPETAGRLLVEGHRGLRDEFEVSGPELDAAVEVAIAAPGCYGARMTGGGFAGCAIALVDRTQVDVFGSTVRPAYTARTGRHAVLHICAASEGTSITTLDLPTS